MEDRVKRYIIFVFFISLILSNCTTVSEKFRYQQRIDAFYNLLEEEEWTLFKKREFEKAGDLIKERLSNNREFFKKWKQMQYNEAIATFDPAQTLKFFYEIIYKELNRPQYYKLMSLMDEPSVIQFAKYENIDKLCEDFYNKNNATKNFMDNLKKEYRLYKFSNREIFEFYRKVIFKEATQKYFYDFCKFINLLNLLNAFEKGEITKFASLKFDNVTEIEFQRIQKLTGLKLRFSDFVNVYYEVVIKEMDKGAVVQTLHKF